MDFSRVQKAAQSALNKVAVTAGQNTDPDLAIYKNLRPADFPKIIEKYGTEGTLSYIAEMERRLKEMEGTNG